MSTRFLRDKEKVDMQKKWYEGGEAKMALQSEEAVQDKKAQDRFFPLSTSRKVGDKAT